MTAIVAVQRIRLRRSATMAGASLIGIILLASILVPILSPYDANDLVGIPYSEPSGDHLFGTDSVGRDVFVRTFYAGRVDLAIAFLVVSASLILGTVYGVVSGAARARWVDSTMMRLVDAVVAFPFLVLALALVVVVGPRTVAGLPAGGLGVIIAIVAVDWSVYARLARGQTLTIMSSDYVAATRVMGLPARRVVLRHVLPGVLPTTLSYAVADVLLVVTITASLSFLGAGVQPPTPEWGAMMHEGSAVLRTSWWITIFPGVMAVLTGLAVTLITDAHLSAGRGHRR
jgi:peptide/nickel transport system permease protein